MARGLPNAIMLSLAALAACLLLWTPVRGDAAPSASAQAAPAVTLTLLHNNDGESSLLPLTNAVDAGGESIQVPIGGIAAYKAVVDRESAAARAAGNALLNVYAGDAYLPSATFVCSRIEGNPLFDAVAQNAISYDAHIIGNHEFDSNPDFLERFIRAFDDQPFLSANLDFSGEPGYADLLAAGGIVELPIEDGRVVGRSMVVTDAATGALFGVVGATTPLLPAISTPRGVTVTPDMQTTAAAVQAEIDRLLDRGVNRIIFVSHLQSVTNDAALIALLSGVDVAVAGGGDELLQNPSVDAALQRLPGERAEASGEYPIRATDADGRTVYIVTTAGNYKYVGRLDIAFGADGEVAGIAAGTSYPRPVVPAGEAATAAGFSAAVDKDAALVADIEGPVGDCLDGLATTTVATTEVLLDVSRGAVRTRESNAGNLISDAFLYSYDQHAAGLGLGRRGADTLVVALQNGGGIRQNAGDVLPAGGSAPGPIYLVNTLDVLPFANAVSVIPGVSPADLKAAFELSISRYPDAAGGFLQVAGVEVTFDPAQPAGSRVVSLTVDGGTALVAGGALVDGAPAVTVVTNSFVAAGGDGYAMFGGISGKLQLPASYEQSLREYLAHLGTVAADDARYAPGGEGRITFVEAPAATRAEPAAGTGPAEPRTGNTGLARADAGPPAAVVVALTLAAAALVATARRAIPGRRHPRSRRAS